ncbi:MULTISPECIES: 16S rRNA (guanine(966)-N(2))-methyltransferase RsmD [unclassified Breznakia]|uniref:16S rRNA (guanine(966)-N(2))-methyltransferase RsmD n=1 Tax=unclassified Breznakia TaxID=2623764 RepID=UPI002475396A|nr:MULTISPECIES: 16S rRNA (guanine(966)-N(2))-methyltransferase RsmD [unclassified Breznakia]MDH6368209.1 16S rRNA (guanine966-N2)-methyltransferase [Breznakia sp. PH1-1]MDH6405299.1 16S rRNA (guanine966-N2)-methyltransferase [Breznakia sp. PF1-11]MDH6413011.1 16S rRNA (guanine966-N2)-methyltransferase [Breznakia sp. PFB1-11]MDH6415374.1 16S rRNA (guanine966-N2)-methyltransferase [Breznakia sp. PFB1-14]MDH6417676.1 16S rRNA (guanine966-N2)-methyltransferase [Breznakia sp. PFB1-4]
MRVCAGKHGSRRLESLKGDLTRPTGDKVKEAIFSSIGPYFDGGVMLDLFGGSGGMALEAISRGMDYAFICDKNKAAIQVIKKNIEILHEQANTSVMQADYHKVLPCLKNERFRLVYLDPPYAMHVYEEIMEYLQENKMLTDDAYVICESDSKVDLPVRIGTLEKYKEKVYGKSKIHMYKGVSE